MTKADLKAGAMKDWGCEPGGWSGYAIHEAKSETELNTILQKYIPYIHFEVTPVLTIDQFVESVTKAAAPAKSAKK
jgi:muconolactone delta-isomerase